MNISAIRNKIRQQVIEASGIDPNTQFFMGGETFDPDGTLQFWCEEYMVGGDYVPMTNKKNKFDTFLFQYNFYVYTGGDLSEAERAVFAVASALSPGGDCSADDLIAHVASTEIKTRYTQKISQISLITSVQVHTT